MMYFNFHYYLNSLELQWREMITKYDTFEKPWTHSKYTQIISKTRSCIFVGIIIFSIYHTIHQIFISLNNPSEKILVYTNRFLFGVTFFVAASILLFKTKQSCRDILHIYGMLYLHFICVYNICFN